MSTEEALEFMITYCVEYTEGGNKDEPEICLFGRKESGESVCLFVGKFYPYFYVFSARRVENTMSSSGALANIVQLPDTVQHLYSNTCRPGSGSFWRVTAPSMHAFYMLRKAMEETYGEHNLFEHKGISLSQRFLIDSKLVPLGWVRVSCGGALGAGAALSGARPAGLKRTMAQFEYELDTNQWRTCIQSLSGDTGYTPQGLSEAHCKLVNKVAPFRTLWFDIECLSGDGGFPVPETGQVIMIGVLVSIGGQVAARILFHLEDVEQPAVASAVSAASASATASSMAAPEFRRCDDESDLLLSFADLVRTVDPELVAGYNSGGFDFPFLFGRADQLDIMKPFSAALSRMRSPAYGAKLVKNSFESNAHGARENFTVQMYGRGSYDLLEEIRRNFKDLHSYTLNAVSEKFLDDHKADVHHSMIPVLFRRSAADRYRLAAYCLKDVELPYEIDKKLQLQTRLVEMSRVCGVDFSDLLERGQQIKVISQLARAARERSLILPIGRISTGYEPTDYAGATVLEPLCGFHDTSSPVMVLDFSSLYPSIMMARNLCYTTFVPRELRASFSADQLFTTAAGHTFLRAAVRRGVLPELLRRLLQQRDSAKRDLKAATDDATRAVMDARQLALKISANSIYGFTGVSVRAGGKLPLFEASESTTAEGRDALLRSAEYVRNTYADATVVYGDSVDGNTPLLVRLNEMVTTKLIKNLAWGEEWKIRPDGKEYLVFDDGELEIGTERGWTGVRQLIRHRVDPGRMLVRVVTPVGKVMCTYDHSLVNADGKEVRPTDVECGVTRLLTYQPSDLVRLEQEQSAFRDLEWLDEDARVLAEYLVNGGQVSAQMSSRLLLYASTTHHGSHLPSALWRQPPSILLATWGHVCAVCGGSENAFVWLNSMQESVPELVFGFWLLLRIIEFPVCFGPSGELMELDGGFDASVDEARVISAACCRVLDGSEYVYDLETENHHFSTYGLVVHNTDSIFVTRKSVTNVHDAWEFMSLLGPEITSALFADMQPMKLLPEKVVSPFVILAKKRYAGIIYKAPPAKGDEAAKGEAAKGEAAKGEAAKGEAAKGELFFKGLEVVRRDNCPLVTSTLLEACRLLLVEGSVDRAVQYLCSVLEDIHMGRVKLSDFIITRSLSREPDKYENKQMHAELVKTLRARGDMGTRVGDRVLLIMVNKGTDKVCEMAEDPLVVIRDRIPVNRKYYIEHQLRKPVERIFTPIIGAEKVARIFDGDHTRKIRVQASSRQGTIGAFFKPIVGVKRACGGGDAEAEAKAVEAKAEAARAEYKQVYESCQRCLGVDGEVVCMQRDCSQLYERLEKLQRLKDIEDLAGK